MGALTLLAKKLDLSIFSENYFFTNYSFIKKIPSFILEFQFPDQTDSKTFDEIKYWSELDLELLKSKIVKRKKKLFIFTKLTNESIFLI